MEFALYRKIKAIECLQRSREQKVGEHRDHITDVIQMTNKVSSDNIFALDMPNVTVDRKLGQRYDPEQRGFEKEGCPCQTVHCCC